MATYKTEYETRNGKTRRVKNLSGAKPETKNKPPKKADASQAASPDAEEKQDKE
jgi:hypothetical protein